MADIIFLSKEGLDRYDLDMKNFIDKKIEEVNKKGIINTTDSVLEGSCAGGLVINNIQGKTEQNAYTGKNLFTFPNVYYNGTGLNITKSTDGTYLLNGTSKNNEIRFYDGYDSKNKNLIVPNGSYKVIATVNGNNIDTYATLGNGESYTSHFGTGFEVTEGFGIASIAVRVPVDETYTNGVLKIMVCLQSEDDIWEPYVGGMPSPSPSYPQDIKSVKGKNLLDCRGLTEQTTNGVTFTPVYDDNGNLEYINVNGVSTNAYFKLGTVIYSYECVLNGCPIGHSNSSAMLFAQTTDGSKTYYDVGNGIKIPANTEMNIFVRIASGYTANNLKFYPMIRSASIKDDTYVPYGLLRIKTHGKNLLELTLDSKTSQGVLFSVDKENGTVTATGKATGYGQYAFEIDAATLKGKTIILSGTPSATSGSMALIIDGTSTRLYAGDNGKTISVPSTCNQIIFQIAFEADAEAKNDVFKPMIRLASITDDTYEPYQENSITLSEPIELNGFNGVYDVVENGKITKKIKRRRLLRSDGWGAHANGWIYTISITDFKYGDIQSGTSYSPKDAFCTHLVYENNAKIITDKVSQGITMWYDKSYSGYRVALYIPNMTGDEWVTFLDENEVYLVYELATSTTEELSDADKIALNSLKTFNGTTYIETDSEVPPVFDVDYGCSQVGAIALENHNNIEINSINDEEKIQDIEKNGFGIELTKAEYDALSEEEKNKGTYWITDYSSSGGSSNIELDKTLSIEGKAADAQAVGKALGKKITLADYLALPEEEQKTGVYWIEDANEPLGDGSRFLKTTDVVDSLDSADSKLPLSANMGREIKEELDNINSDLLEKSRIHLDYAINLTQYIATGEYFNLQSDGYIVVECPAGNNNQCYAQDAYSNHILAVARSNGTLNGFASVYVRKGMSIAIYGNGTSKFLPFIE